MVINHKPKSLNKIDNIWYGYLYLWETDNGYLYLWETDNGYLYLWETDNDYLYLWETDNGLESIIPPVLDVTRLALFIRYIYLSNVQLLNIAIIKS
jgi:hypothetical protein